jgi:hypothetical protein
MAGLVRERRRRVVNRVLILVAVAALLGGLALGHWDGVLNYARWL